VAAEDSNFTRFIAGFRRIKLLPPNISAIGRAGCSAGSNVAAVIPLQSKSVAKGRLI